MSEWIVTPSAIKERQVDVVVVGGGTSGAIAAVAAARNGADTMVVEQKGYFGGIAVEGGTALHSFYNLWQAFPGQEKRQLIRGIPQELIERLVQVGGCSGHVPMDLGFNYDSVCTVIDVEITKYILHQMVEEAGVRQALNTVIVDVQRNGDRVESILLSSHGHLERVYAKNFIDATGFGDLCALAGAQYTEPNDHSVANSIGVGGVDVEAYANFFREKGALVQYARGVRDGKEGRAIRVQGNFAKASPELAEEARAIGMASVITTLHDGYFMFLKLNFKTPASPADPETLSQAELELRRRQQRAVELFRKYIPGCSKAFIARSS
ncbi:MAG: FAD-dependent oxidoreductase, partial [Lentisphaerae bacterium]